MIQKHSLISFFILFATSTTAFASRGVDLRCTGWRNQVIEAHLTLTGESVKFKGKTFAKDQCEKHTLPSVTQYQGTNITIDCESKNNSGEKLSVSLSIVVNSEGKIAQAGYTYSEGSSFYSMPGPSNFEMNCTQSGLF